MEPQQPIDIWREKLEFLLLEEAKTSDPGQKFALKKEIEEAQAKIAELEHEETTQGETGNAPVVSIAHLPAAVTHFVGREKEMARLDAAWNDPGTTVISLVAFGGVGKSALVAEWLQRLKQDGWRGARCVLGHSFYSQGAREDTQASADAFIDQALRFFGDPEPERGSPWDKGERLARLARKTKTLLVLDGMEPLQYGPAAGDAGRIKDPALQALVRELAASNPGLCVITTRQKVADIPTAPEIDLERLSPKAGAALLEALGVEGTQDALEDASRQVRGHGLALRLLGTYLRRAYNGDVQRLPDVRLLDADDVQGGHARHIIERYERHLGEGPSLSIMRLLGLFDRPAAAAELAAVRAAPPIAGLTDQLVDLSGPQWNWAISTLVECGLLNMESGDSTLDAHPLVREHFADQLAAEHPDATREAHRRLYEYLKESAPELPDTLQEMMPLYHAVAHGCKAGLWQEAHDDVYFPRIRRRHEDFVVRKLGAIGTDLAALSSFYSKAWTEPAEYFSEAIKSSLLNVTGFQLRALGRLHEAMAPMTASLKSRLIRAIWNHAAIDASNLSNLYLTLGDVSAAVRAAEQGVELADRSSDAFQRIVDRTTLADALHQFARPEHSLAAFREAEAMQAERQPAYPLLYSLRGFLYCDLLLDEAPQVFGSWTFAGPVSDESQLEAALQSCREVRRRAETTLKWYGDDPTMGTLNFALDHMTLGRTYLLEDQVSRIAGQEPEDEVLTQAETYLNQSVSLLRQAGDQTYLPHGLLARAALWRVCGARDRGSQEEAETAYFERAERDLGEVDQIAGRSGMLLWQIEAALERCRLALTREDRDAARRKLDEASALVKQTEKPYAPHGPDWEDWEPPDYVGVIKEGEIVGYHRRNAEIAALEAVLAGSAG